MSLELIIATVWKRKLIFLITLILCAGAVVAITFLLPKAYSATATMFIGNRSEDSASLIFDTNAGEQLTRTYTALAANPNVANAVRQRLPGAPSVESLLNRVSFSPVERTQLLEITATDDSPTAARRLANVYAGTFVAQVGAQFDRGAAPTQITLSQPAPLPISPSSPNTPLYLGFGVLLSLLLAVGATLLRDRFDDSLHLTPDADSVLGQPILLRLPELSRLSPVGRAAVQDALRLLRANIDFAQAGHSQVVAITSSAPVQGKSTTAAQLALTSAADGERTVLIEADLRRPGLIHTEIGKNMERSLVGLSNYLASMATSDEILTPHPDRPNLSIIWPGPLSPNPGVLLGSERLPALINELRKSFDRIIIDTPPVSVGADASVTVTKVDGTLLVIDQRDSSLRQVRTGLKQLERTRAPVLGIVLNRAGSRREIEGYGYYTAPAPEPGLDDPADPAKPPAGARP